MATAHCNNNIDQHSPFAADQHLSRSCCASACSMHVLLWTLWQFSKMPEQQLW
jgi:hypothetical protein